MRSCLVQLSAFALVLLSASALSACALPAQTQTPSAAVPPPTIRTGTQLVILDVVVQDSRGNPIHNLKHDDFQVAEKKQPQTVRHFEEHTSADHPPAGPTMPPLPAGTFTNYTPTPATGALNVLLLDTLNTPMSDQAYVRQQLQQYVKKAPAGQRVAIFGLSSRLFMLQGFTADPTLLRDAVEHKLIPRGSALLDDPSGSGVDQTKMSDLATDMGPSMEAVAANLQQFEAETAAFQTQLRIQYTLDAFNAIGHYLSAFPGRKNLIWFSGSFPINIMPDPDIQNPFNVVNINEDEFRQTTNLLARAQVAVYPVDARGLMADPTFSAANSGRGYARTPAAAGKASMKFLQSQAEEHMTMDQLAEDTGGHAFYNTNDLAGAVSKAIDAGSNYYTLAYTPTDRNWDGQYRSIRVTLNPRLAAAGYHLSYRHGYVADDPADPKSHISPAVTTVAALAEKTHGVTYAQTAMSHGAPEPQELLFKVRILPASTTTEDTLAPNNTTDPLHPLKPPFRRFVIDFAALDSGVVLETTADGRRKGSLDFSAFLFDNNGQLLNATGSTVQINIPADRYKEFQEGAARLELQISAPVKSATYLRVGVHDLTSNRIGAYEIPLASVARLPPPPELMHPAPAAGAPAADKPAAGVNSTQPAAQPKP